MTMLNYQEYWNSLSHDEKLRQSKGVEELMAQLRSMEPQEESMNEEKQTTHEYDFRKFDLFGHMYFWGRTQSTTDVLDENERMLFNIPFVAEERDVRMALFGYLQHDLRKFAQKAQEKKS